MKVFPTSAVALCLASCATDNSQDYEQAVSREFYELIQCSGCDVDFQRVAVPDSYDLPVEDLGECFAYVLDQNPDSRNLLFSAWMECVENAPN